MKKIFLLFLGILFITSCSNDPESTTFNETGLDSHQNFKAKNGNELDKLYKVMITSQDYINFNSGIEIFLDKMNYTGDGSDLVDQTKMLNWISDNISKTSFTSYNSAVGDLNEINNNSVLVLKNNIGFFSELTGKPIDVLDIALQGDDVPPQGASSCSTDCWFDRFSCRLVANRNYRKAMGDTWDLMYSDLDDNIWAGGASISIIQLAWVNDRRACNKAYNACMKKC